MKRINHLSKRQHSIPKQEPDAHSFKPSDLRQDTPGSVLSRERQKKNLCLPYISSYDSDTHSYVAERRADQGAASCTQFQIRQLMRGAAAQIPDISI
jgi:hypothetical protein